MPSKFQTDETCMETAYLYAKLSKAVKKKVGAVILTSQEVILPGYNGTPCGCDNACEITMFGGVYNTTPIGFITKPEVIHAELNCIMKAAREGISVLGSTLYTTLSPCVQCSAMLIQSGVSRVVYDEIYRDETGIDLLISAGIVVNRYTT